MDSDQNSDASPSPNSRLPRPGSLYRKWISWLRLQKLKWEVRRSQKFKSKCEELRCFTLAGLEEQYRKEVETKIRQLEQER